MKKLLLIVLAVSFVVFLLPSISALDVTWDNVKVYDKANEEITFKNSFLGFPTTTIAKVKLVNQYYEGAATRNVRLDMYLDEDYKDPIRNMRFIRMLGANNITYQIFVNSTPEIIQEPIYTTNCVINKDNSSAQDCVSTQTGTKEVVQDTWIPIPEQLPKGYHKILIKIEGSVYDEYDWVGNFFGVEATEWAVFDNALVGYWDFDQPEDNATLVTNVDNSSILNFTRFTDGALKKVPGKVGPFAGNYTSAASDFLGNLSYDPSALTQFSWSAWINVTDNVAEQKILMHIDVGNGLRQLQVQAGDLKFGLGDGTSNFEVSNSISEDVWHFVVVTAQDGDAIRMYIDNDNVANTTFAGTMENNLAPWYVVGNQNVNQFYGGMLDEIGYWEVELTADDVDELWNGGAGNAFPSGIFSNITVALDDPIDGFITTRVDLNFSGTFTPTELNLTNATLMVYSSPTVLFNETTNTVTGQVANFSNFSLFNISAGNYIWNILACGINNTGTFCTQALNNFTFSIGTEVTGNTSSNFTYETAQESYAANITIPAGETISSAELIYNGTAHTAIVTNVVANNFTLASTIDIPISAVPSSQWFWQITFGTGGVSNTSANTQPVGAISLSLQGQGIGGSNYINFTFENETIAGESVSATFDSTWTYFLGTGAINKTLTFTNASENFNYSFQFHPQNRTLFTDMEVSYTNAESQQRTFNPTLFTLTNNTLVQTLLLLPTSNGIFQQFVTQTLVGNTIADVNFIINRTIGGVPTEITSGTTDGSGFVSLFLNPDFTYSALFTKDTFIPNTFSFQPSNQLRTVIMGSIQAVGNGSTISRNTNISIIPINTSLNNGTDVLFGFEVNSTEDITSISMNITNLSGFQVGFQSNTGAGFISQTINTGENNTFLGTFIYSTGNETITFTKVWQISLNFEGDYSIFRQGSLYITYGFEDFIRLILVIFIIGGVLIFMSASEVIDTSESKLAVAVLLVWAFSVIGWLNTGIPITDSGGFVVLSQFSNQYGIAMVSTGAALFFMGRRIFT